MILHYIFDGDIVDYDEIAVCQMYIAAVRHYLQSERSRGYEN